MTHPFDSPVNIFTGIRNGQVVYSANILAGQSPTLNQLNWQSIDEVKVTSHYNTGHFVIDDLQYSMSSVPIPTAAWLLGSGLLGLIGMARRKAA